MSEPYNLIVPEILALRWVCHSCDYYGPDSQICEISAEYVSEFEDCCNLHSQGGTGKPYEDDSLDQEMCLPIPRYRQEEKMREIKFRVPIMCNVCGFKGFQYWEWNGQQFIESGYDKCGCEKPAFEIIGEPQQRVGLEDKSRIMAYDKDVIAYSFGQYPDYRQTTGVIGWYRDLACWGLDEPWPFRQMLIPGLPDIFEIIGNTHQNAEMVGVKE